jgi:hypothetical protein
MEPVRTVESGLAFDLPDILPGGRKLFVAAMGTVPTSGWSHGQLSPRYPLVPPEDGIWEFDFVADAPHGIVLDVVLPITAVTIQGCPDWVKGVRIIARDNEKTVMLDSKPTLVAASAPKIRKTADRGHVVVSETIAVYDDSFQPIGFCGGFHLKMKKLRHELILTVEGPDEAKIRSCLSQAVAAGLIAAIISAFVTGGAALPAAIAAATSTLEACLGRGFSIRFDNRSHWIEWCT